MSELQQKIVRCVNFNMWVVIFMYCKEAFVILVTIGKYDFGSFKNMGLVHFYPILEFVCVLFNNYHK